jgi:signal transduction histidine kinase
VGLGFILFFRLNCDPKLVWLNVLFHVIKLGKSPVYQNFLNSLKQSALVAQLIFFSCTFCGAQNSTIDSLRALLEDKTGNDRFDVLYELSFNLILNDDNSSALKYADEAYQLAQGKGDSLRLVKAVLVKGSALRRLERIDESIDIYKLGIRVARQNDFKNEIKILLNSIAIAYSLKADYDNALEYHFQSLVVRERLGNKAEVSITLNNIGFVYFKLRNYEKAREYFSRSLTLRKEANDTYDLDRLLINLGMTNVHLGNFDEALDYINEGLKTCDKNCSDEVIIEGKFGLGVSYFGLDKLDDAALYFNESLEVAKKTSNKRFQAENLVYLAKIAIAKEDNDGAKTFLTEAEILAGSSGYNQLLIDAYKQFSILYTQVKNFESASIYQNKYITLKDSLIGEELVKNVAKIQTNFEERTNIAMIADREEALKRQRNLNLAIGVIAVLTGLLGFVLYRSNVVTRRVNSALSDAKGVIETQNLRLQNINRELDGKVKEKTADLVKANTELDAANKSLSQVNDELDNFIYKTSHDIRGPLASLKGICSVALMDVKDPLALDYLNKLDISSGRLNVILTRLLIVNQINNAILGKEPIDFKAIVNDVILLEKKKGLPVRFEIKVDIQTDIVMQSDKDLVRIILENLIDNAIKFYNDSDRTTPFVHIKIGSENGKEVLVHVIDNGIGIAEAKPDKIFQMFSRASERSGTGGIGLYLSKLATEKLGGQIHLRTTPEGYTEFYVSFPAKMPEVKKT